MYLQGELDDNDTLPFTDAFDDPQREEILKAFHPWVLKEYKNPLDFNTLMEALDREDMLARWDAHRQILSDLGYDNIQAITVKEAGHGLNGAYYKKISIFYSNDNCFSAFFTCLDIIL
jgi:hypothetical protein